MKNMEIKEIKETATEARTANAEPTATVQPSAAIFRSLTFNRHAIVRRTSWTSSDKEPFPGLFCVKTEATTLRSLLPLVRHP
jgi:hypothetical protein